MNYSVKRKSKLFVFHLFRPHGHFQLVQCPKIFVDLFAVKEKCVISVKHSGKEKLGVFRYPYFWRIRLDVPWNMLKTETLIDVRSFK
jgi:hypothetical protein